MVMKKKTKQQFLNPLAITIGLIVLFTVINAIGAVSAQDAASGGTTGTSSGTTSTANEQSCIDGMTPFIAQQTASYYGFLEQTFQNKDSSSSLVDTSVEKYREFRKSLINKWYTYFPQGGQFFSIANLEPGQCMAMIDQALSEARRAIQEKATTTAVVKQTSALLEKYQSLNSELRDLADTMVKFKANLDVFTNKVACFVKSGCTKG